jgi:hypothetical protein
MLPFGCVSLGLRLPCVTLAFTLRVYAPFLLRFRCIAFPFRCLSVALRCVALRCVALRCVALRCVALRFLLRCLSFALRFLLRSVVFPLRCLNPVA